MATTRKLNLHVVEVDCYEICGDTTASTEARMRNSFHKGMYFRWHCVLYCYFILGYFIHLNSIDNFHVIFSILVCTVYSTFIKHSLSGQR
jgi:acyl-ACP thioesterase